MSDWAGDLRVLLVNRDSASNCVTWGGCSVVDVTWSTPEAFRRVSGRRVAEGVETLSDHLYIFMEAGNTPRPAVTAISGDCSGRVSSVGAPGVAEIYPLESAGPRGGRGRVGDARRPGIRRGRCVGPVAVSADQRRRRISRRSGDPPKLGDMEVPSRPPADLQDKPSAHETAYSMST